MNRTLTILAAALICVAIGCEKKRENPPETARYDPRIDGPPDILAPAADERILADQTRVTAPRPVVVPAPPAPASATQADLQALKQQMAAAMAEAKGGNVAGLAALFPDSIATGMRDMLLLPGKMQAFEQLVKDKLGMELPDKFKSETSGPIAGAGPGPASMSPVGDLEKGSVDDLKFTIDGPNIVATDPKGQKTVFVKTAQGWKMQVPPEAQEFMTVMLEVAEAAVKVTDTLTAGINDGSITKDNFEAKADEVGEQHMKAPMEKFAKIFGEMMKKGFEQVPTPAPPTPTPALPTPTPTPAPPAPGADTDIAALSQQLSTAEQAANAGNVEPFLNLFSEPTAGTFRKVLTLKKKADDLKPVLSKQFGVLGTHLLKAQFDQTGAMAKKVPAGPVAKMTFAKDGSNILLTTQDIDEAIVFAKTAQGWKGSLSAGQEKEAADKADLVNRMISFFDELTAGINGGSITSDNLDQKVMELQIKHALIDARREAPRRTTF
jgi:hypothetical protein